jgi:hypothetical protein
MAALPDGTWAMPSVTTASISGSGICDRSVITRLSPKLACRARTSPSAVGRDGKTAEGPARKSS